MLKFNSFYSIRNSMRGIDPALQRDDSGGIGRAFVISSLPKDLYSSAQPPFVVLMQGWIQSIEKLLFYLSFLKKETKTYALRKLRLSLIYNRDLTSSLHPRANLLDDLGSRMYVLLPRVGLRADGGVV